MTILHSMIIIILTRLVVPPENIMYPSFFSSLLSLARWCQFGSGVGVLPTGCSYIYIYIYYGLLGRVVLESVVNVGYLQNNEDNFEKSRARTVVVVAVVL